MLRFAPLMLLPLVLSACKDETVSGYTQVTTDFVLEEVNGSPFAARATINLGETGVISGEGPCNGYTAAQKAPYPWFEIGPIAATKRACPDLRQEAKFFDALQGMTLSEVTGGVLILSNTSGGQMVFNAAP
ncbi:META domain-containing protein [Alphaproteobacteria bacterium KMM 3653]|uniref:META domain-containing protein n=1 Tax=Harenicola maris TaxID=2841044 RepID=A0AAP2CSE4_9RHOB|nr:META domain-containing protein [Harenicola maris]